MVGLPCVVTYLSLALLRHRCRIIPFLGKYLHLGTPHPYFNITLCARARRPGQVANGVLIPGLGGESGIGGFNILSQSQTSLLSIQEGIVFLNFSPYYVWFIDKFTTQGDLFSKAILENLEQAISLEDSFANMAVIDAVFRSAKTGNWETPERL